MSSTRTFCFTDIEGSTRLLTRLGNDVYETVQDIQRAVLREAWSTHGGTEIRSEGDGGFVVFDAPESAIAACLQAQLMLKEAEWPADVEVRVRMGMHTGEANPTSDGDFVGLAVHHAARVGSAANGGQVLVSEATADAADALPDFSALIDLGSFRLRDIDAPLHLFVVEHPDLARDPRPPRAPSSMVHNLPIVRTAFIGRGDEVREVTKLIAGQPMVTILGTGGVGKTRLALEAASASIGVFADGAWLVELAAVDDPALVAPRVASALGLEDDPSRPSIDVIVDHLRDRQLLLVLDNCEHLLDPVAELVDAALRSSEGSTVLATSREPLRIRGETAWRLPPFSESEAAELFADRARIADGSFVLDGSTADTVAHICNRLDGIALALELAASRLRSMSLTELASSLDDRFTTLVGGYRTDLPRQQTLRAAIDWSYELLDTEEQTLFASLSVFRGGATLDAISAVCGSVVAQLGVLVDRSLVDPADERYTMLETLHAYASERLEESGRADDVREAHRDHFSKPTSIDCLYAEQDNIRAALSFRTDEKMLVLASVASPIWHRYGPYREGYRWLTQALHANPEPSEARADALGALIALLPSMGRFDECAAAFDEVLEWHRSTNNDAAVASALLARAEFALTLGDVASAKVDLDAALSYHVDDGGDHEGRCHHALAHIALAELRLNDARAHASASAARFRNVKGVNLEAAALMMLGRVEQAAFRFEDAGRHFEEALALHRSIGDRSNIAYTGWHFGSLQIAMGELSRGIATLRESFELSEEIGDMNAPLVLASLGNALFLSGRRDEGRRTLEDAITRMESMRHPYGIPYGYGYRADIALIDGELDLASAEASRAAEGFLAMEDSSGLCGALLRVAAADTLLGNHDRAARLYGCVEANTGNPLSLEQVAGQPLEPTVGITRDSLGPEVYEAARADGSTLTLAQAVALASRHTIPDR